MSIELHGIDEAELFLKKLGNSTKTILSNSLNQLAVKTRSNAVDSITGELNLAKPYVSGKLLLERSNAKSLIAKIRSAKKGLLLSHFGATALYVGNKRSAGVSVQVKRNRKTLKKAFMFRAKNGQTMIAIRTGKARKDIKVLYGPSTSQAFETFSDSLEKQAFTDFDSIFNQALDRLIS
jgi:hypothetical protein